jgi:hypothetical protein
VNIKHLDTDCRQTEACHYTDDDCNEGVLHGCWLLAKGLSILFFED